jgi:protein-S-isoprenylcysteine O-methyltransferase Ste14
VRLLLPSPSFEPENHGCFGADPAEQSCVHNEGPHNADRLSYHGCMKMPEAFHGHPVCLVIWIIMFGLCIVPEFVRSRRLRAGQDAQKSDKGSEFVVIMAANLALVVGFISAIVFSGLSIESYWKPIFDAGIVIWLCGTIFRWYSISALGRFFTYDVAVSSDQPVVQKGPYRWLRHPSYLGSLLAVMGYGITLTNWLAILLPALCLGTAYAYRIRVEEQALLQGLGSPYREYMKRTWRLIPFVF